MSSSIGYPAAGPRFRFASLVAVLALAATLACGDDKSPVAPPVGNGGGNGNGNGAMNRTVSMTDNVFAPSSLTITVGDTVTWVNNGQMPHTVTSGPEGSPNGIFNSGDITAGGTYRRVFTSAGSFPYYCVYHAGMTGSVTVTQ